MVGAALSGFPATRARRAAMALTLLACAVGAHGERVAAAGELRVGVPRLPAVLDPATGVSGPDLMIYRLLFQGLVQRGDRGEIRPALATRWTVSRDGLTWTFRLRPDARFQNGGPVTADDVIASLSRHLSAEEPPEPVAPWSRLFQGAARVVHEVRRGDSGTVELRLGQPFSPLLAVLANPAFAVATPQNDSDVPFLGTGPYRVAERGPGRLVLAALPSATAPTQRIVLSEAADDAAGIARLDPGGALDVYVARGPPGGAGLGLQILSAPTWRVGFLALRTDKGVLRQKPVRQAIGLALNPELVQPAILPWAVPYGAYLPPGAWGAREAPPAFDGRRARRLIEQAGAADAALTLVAPESAGGPDASRLAEAIRLALAAVGLKVTVRVGLPDEALRVMRQGEADMALYEVQLPVDDPHFLFHPLLASEAATPDVGTNLAFFKSPLVDGMLFRASQLGYRPERLRLYQRLQATVAEESPYVPLYARLQWVIARPTVRGLSLDPAGGPRLDQAWVEALPEPPDRTLPPVPPPPAMPSIAPVPSSPGAPSLPATPATPPGLPAVPVTPAVPPAPSGEARP